MDEQILRKETKITGPSYWAHVVTEWRDVDRRPYLTTVTLFDQRSTSWEPVALYRVETADVAEADGEVTRLLGQFS